MHQLYIKDRLIGTYKTHKAARIALAKIRFKVNIDGWYIVEVN